MNRLTTPFLTATLVACLISSARATTISFGNVDLLPNTPDQTFPVLVSGGNENNIVGADLFVVVGDGGPPYNSMETDDAPGMVNLPGDVNLTGPGTIFFPNNTGSFDLGGSTPQFPNYGVNTNQMQGSGFVSDTASNSVLAYLTFDSTGFTSGSWPVYLDDLSLGLTDSTNFVLKSGSNVTSFFPTLVTGSITIEPASPSRTHCLFS